MTISQKLIKKLQSIKENKLTIEVIIPFLESLNYKKVEFNGGVYEEGKDIIMWEEDRFGDTKVSVAQVKHFKLSNKASGNDSLQTVINQLENCIKKPILFTDKIHYLPSKTILISTYPINTTTLKTRFSENTCIKDHDITIIDGDKLCDLLIKNRKDIVDSLLGIEINIPEKISPTLNNEILLRALGYNNKISINKIYTDINFNLGRRIPKILLKEKYDPIEQQFDLTLNQWNQFKSLCETISIEYKIDFLNCTLQEVDSSVDQTTYKKWQSSLQDKIKNHERKLIEVKKARNDLQEKARKRRVLDNQQYDNQALSDADELLKIAESKLSLLEKELSLANTHVQKLKVAKPSVIFNITIDGHKLSNQIIFKHNWLIDEINKINSESIVTKEVLRNFLKNTELLISTTELIFNNPFIVNCLKPKEDDIIEEESSPRLSIDIHKLFDTGMNFIVLGEAGAGKTTTLQMYASKQSQKDNKIPIWISLSRMIQYVNEIQNNKKSLDLTQCINIYLTKLGVPSGVDVLCELFKSNKTILLLDGLDEAIKPGPWLPAEIHRFSKLYNSNTQVIVSSRLSTKEVSEVGFFPITLLPFTNEQRNSFIKQWFSEIDNEVIYRRVANHLDINKEVADIVRNPLLTTTLCVLAENNLPLPRTEINLYNDRIKLLTGYYDNVKNIISRITITPHHLETLSMKLAFFLHTNNSREDTIESLTIIAINSMKNHLSRDQASMAVQELIDPCNILIPMTKNGQYGFGHLRYQEHLAAKEILSNRSIKLQILLKNQWWKGAFTIFSKLNDTIDWFIKELGKYELVTKNQDILCEIIAARPKHEQDALMAFLQKHIIAETGNI
ncbi:NACHT domain-containing NTPase [Sphingobacterium sp. BIGb0116]|uniref:NACHT domain-containing protein n=1 Tax=Sphingobacterium sp. BIGb0116 TaxID=2940619 RepID=UPI002167A6B8|nr:hypothetical protein [Sphingobacterium sp. BIGb0116]MCS4162941.1 nucleoside-triphosphatase THEP1 [Sphingobacterium sp. BIGb0116]